MDDNERGVRRYLAYLADKIAPIDADHLATLGKELQTANDPIVRLHILSEIERTKRPDQASLEADFVANAYEWAQENNIVASAFRAMGVRNDLLRRAGFETVSKTNLAKSKVAIGSKVTNQANSDSVSKAKFSSEKTRPLRGSVETERKMPVRIDLVQQVVRSQTKPFTISQIAKVSEASIATARIAITTLVAAGEVRSAGAIVGLQGKAPMTYEVVKR
jgi:response regulator of citrate/malate metabolism